MVMLKTVPVFVWDIVVTVSLVMRLSTVVVTLLTLTTLTSLTLLTLTAVNWVKHRASANKLPTHGILN